LKKSQAEKTGSAILVIGDTWHLNFHLYKQGVKQMSQIDEKEEHGTLFLLHPGDERPFVRASLFKHSSKGVRKGKGIMNL
jgi:hypothetical protein